MKKLNKKAKIKIHPNHQSVINTMRRWNNEVAKLVPGTSASVDWKYRIDQGQMYRFGLKSSQFDHALVRVFVPEDGFPTIIEFDGEEHEFSNVDKLEDYLYKKLIVHKDMVATLQSMLAIMESMVVDETTPTCPGSSPAGHLPNKRR